LPYSIVSRCMSEITRPRVVSYGIVQLTCKKRAVPRWRTGINRAANRQPFYAAVFSKARTAEDASAHLMCLFNIPGILNMLNDLAGNTLPSFASGVIMRPLLSFFDLM